MKRHAAMLAGAAAIVAGAVILGAFAFGGPASAGSQVTPTADPCITPQATPTGVPDAVAENDGRMQAFFQQQATATPDCTTRVPKTHTPTPDPTDTPAPTEEPASPTSPPATNTPTGGSEGGGIQPPNTGTGGGDSGTPTWALIAALSLVAGGATAVAAAAAYGYGRK